MEEQGKKKVHITWEEAVRAEAEQDKARQARCRPIPPSPLELTTVLVSRDLSKLKASAQRLWDAASSRTLKTTRETAGVNSQTSNSRHEGPAEESQRGQFGNLAVGFRDEPPENCFKRGPTRSAIAIVLGIILLAGIGTMSYWQQSKKYLSHRTIKGGAIAQRGVGYTSSDPEMMVENSKAQSTTPQRSPTSDQPGQSDGREIKAQSAPSYLGNFEVVDNSFVRDKPQPNAIIIATLRPGTQVRVESKTGDYLRIRSFKNDAEFTGYVHEEDAFFQAH